MLDGLGGTQGTRETGPAPTYVTAEAETSELPKIVAESPPKPSDSPVKRSRIGDLPMRVIYRILAVGVALVLAAVATVVGFVSSGSSDQPGGGKTGQVAAPSAAPPSPGPGSPEPSAPVSASASEQASPSESPAETASPSPSPEGWEPAPDRSAVIAALADSRVPALPRDKRLGRLPGKVYKSKRRVEDDRSGVSLIRFGKPWKIFGASPFSTKQVLPKVKGVAHRAMLASCPVPILVQRKPKDTALLAARWTLNHHPKGSRIAWVASQPIKGGWMLAYRVKYKIKKKTRSSMAAVAVVQGPGAKPAMLFVTIPDAQSKRWRDINTAVSSLRLLK
ncbi:hypothetical protein OG884_05195 [Streptosporangium sp. NBC_01755]|uniref:hypothetical protein n=1 Tax=unclassified Streptosporangium TaxID=2632669 RepID=UPI002DDBF487|nr:MULTISPECIES: hypothetical protein [unclassified Streptosporangium]WSA27112.1 hypothetical protein OIE13_04285 [Streptosporangium sp. NBC_01810]WSD01327.1 hypothetical protein OG884_05195 [Streptosporangium sp. NBC_01755]